jgi:molybdenum cofactor guanylyltransferase
MLLGVVLCGGKSSRMGSDKGLIKTENDLTWSEAAYHKLQRLELDVFVSINPSQRETYKDIFPTSILIEDEMAPVFTFEGPLRGILSLHRLYPEHDVFVLACDMTEMDLSTLQQLMDNYTRFKNDYDNFVFQCKKRLEPLCCIYGHRGLRKLYYRAIHGQLYHQSLQQVLSSSQSSVIQVNDQCAQLFTNYNNPVDTSKEK